MVVLGQRFEAFGATTAGVTDGTQITANAAANTKGVYAELIASTSFDYEGVMLEFGFVTGGVEWLIDIAIGAGGSEQIVIADLHYTFATALSAPYLFVPLRIPAGSRISARCQSSTGGASTWIMGHGIAKVTDPLSRVTTYGAAAADSGGVSVDPGAVANTKGAYSQVVASTTYPIKHLILGFGINGDTARTSCRWLVDIAIGASGSEQIIVPNLLLNAHLSSDDITPHFVEFPCDIPAGVAISARAQCTTTTAGDRLFDIIVYGVD